MFVSTAEIESISAVEVFQNKVCPTQWAGFVLRLYISLSSFISLLFESTMGSLSITTLLASSP
jgi:hypothetical protein